MSWIDPVRRMIGVRQERQVAPAGPRPRLGAKIVLGDARITVQAGLNEGTWDWLVKQGWREESYRNNRRRYREVPPSLVAELFDATDPGEREQLLSLALEEASVRPVVNLRHR